MAIEFALVRAAFGSEIAGAIGEVGVAQLQPAIAEDGCDSIDGWVAHWADELGQDPEALTTAFAAR